MSAVLQPDPLRFEPLRLGDALALDRLMEVENRAYAVPWNYANFTDGLQSGYLVQRLLAEDQLLAYYVAMKGVDEVHLLNLTVAPEYQRQGWAHLCLDNLAAWSHAQGAKCLWLEARASNARATAVYEKFGFRRVGHRKAYYPTGTPMREDATVMSLNL